MNQTYRLLALCARAEGHPLFYEQLNCQIEQFTAWDELPAQAEIFGIGPLLWHHLRQAEISIPSETERTLRGMYLRERALNQAHTRTLVELQSLLGQAGIQALILKGLAIAYKYYPDPALRPVSDIDLLLKKEDMLSTLHILGDAGYRVNFPDSGLNILPNELTADSPSHDGVSTHLEFHHYDPNHRRLNDYSHDNELTGFDEPPQVLMINDCPVYTPSPMDTLRYVERHMVRHLFESRTDKPLPLKWSADIISMVEYHAEEIDWVEIQRDKTAFLNRLAVLYSLTPLPEKYKNVIPVNMNEPPTGVNQYPAGWPQQAFHNWKQVGSWRFIWFTFKPPSAWWLRLYYGTNEGSEFWYGQVVYRLRVLRVMLWGVLRHIFPK